MGTNRIRGLAVVVLFALCASNCSRSEKSKELVALDKAYQAGVITKDEYEVKKAAFQSAAEARTALDQARDAGVLTKEEYDARIARLDAKVAALAALEKALRAGVVSKEEYLTKKAALLAPETTMPVAVAANST